MRLGTGVPGSLAGRMAEAAPLLCPDGAEQFVPEERIEDGRSAASTHGDGHGPRAAGKLEAGPVRAGCS